jgi:hypothetical protein
MSKALLVLLTVTSGIFTVAGMATVAINYFGTAHLARTMKEQLDEEAVQRSALGNLAWIEDYQFESVNLQPTKERLDDLRRTVLDSLSPRWYLGAGLGCLVIGAMLGVAAGVGGVLR